MKSTMTHSPYSKNIRAEATSPMSGNGFLRMMPIWKRLFDICLALVLIIATLPFVIVIAIIIKTEDGGPVFFIQKRWGKQKRKFNAIKFRSMHPNADRENGFSPATDNDPHVSRIGGFLRAIGMDELPQLINVLKGDMSFVGPRPFAVGEMVTNRHGKVVQYEDIPMFEDRLAVRPGLTGIAAIYIPKKSLPERKIRYDLLYIRKQGLWLDIRLLFITLWICIKGNWEKSGDKF